MYMKAVIVCLGFVTLIFASSVTADGTDTPEESASCGKCWKIWEKSLKRSIYYTALASETESKLAGGESAAWWEEHTQKTLEKIRQCCSVEQSNQDCNQLDSPSVRKMCVTEIFQSEPEVDISKDIGTEDSTKPTCDQSQPNWVRGLLDAFGFCDSSPQSLHWDDCKRIKQNCIYHCSDDFLPGDRFRFDHCVRECLREAGCL